jgi:hypothetical protein
MIKVDIKVKVDKHLGIKGVYISAYIVFDQAITFVYIHTCIFLYLYRCI